jgi:UPF0042 nucleotide-binding protein
MKLTIVSGLSGSGKSIALNTLEDCGYYCIDNLPVSLLENFVSHIILLEKQIYAKTAISIDARNQTESLLDFADRLEFIRRQDISCNVMYLQATEATLLKRYSETRRKHPLTTKLNLTLTDAIKLEEDILQPVAQCADIVLDSSKTSCHQLRELVKEQIGEKYQHTLSLQFQSFGFKHGLPLDADFVFDARCLPNPYWMAELRGLTGRDLPVVEFLQKQQYVQDLLTDIVKFIERWADRFAVENRSYLTIAIGCTGGQHRSVYLVEALAKHFQKSDLSIIIRHRELQ